MSGNQNPWRSLGSDHCARWFDDFEGIEFTDGDETVYLDGEVAWRLFQFSRGAQGLPLCPDKGPTPAESAGVQAGAKRSPKGCLDAVANAGHLLEVHGWTRILIDRSDVLFGSQWYPGVSMHCVMPGEACRDPREAACCA